MNDVGASERLEEWYREARVHHKAGRLAEAEDLYQRVLRYAPDSTQSQRLRSGLSTTVCESSTGPLWSSPTCRRRILRRSYVVVSVWDLCGGGSF